MRKLLASEAIEIDDAFMEAVSKKLSEKKSNENNDEKFYTVKQVAAIVHKHPFTVWSHIKNHNEDTGKHRLKAVKSGKNWLVPKESLDEYLNQS